MLHKNGLVCRYATWNMHYAITTMPTLDVWGAIAAAILLLQCIVFNLVFVGLAVGLWYGSRWVRGKAVPSFSTIDKYATKAQHYAITGQQKVVQPFISLRAGVAQIRTIIQNFRGS